MNNNKSKREHWSSRTTFLLAITGASVGLANLWRFPYVAGENGGGAFVLLYLFFILVIGIPLVMAELALGKLGSQNPVSTITDICKENRKPSFWQAIGWFSIMAPLLAATFFSVIAGWSLFYLLKAAANTFAGITAPEADLLFNNLLASPGTLFALHSVYLAGVVFVISKGIRRGIESVTKIMMPVLFVTLLFLAIYANIVGDASASWHFLFYPDFSKLSNQSVLIALGQALMSISVGTGAIITYGSYLPKDISIPMAAWTIGLVDTATALLAGLAIFPIVFAYNLAPAEGPGLIFVTLPIALGNMAGGQFLGILFFSLVFMAAFTSSLAMLEPFVSWATEKKGYNRLPVSLWTGFGVWLVGISTVLSFNILKDFKPLSMIPALQDRTIFLLFDFIVSNVILPLNVLLIALFAGWVLGTKVMRENIGLVDRRAIWSWSVATKYLSPLALIMVFLYNL